MIRSLLCKPHAFSPAITRTWNTWSRTESACVESTTRHYNRGARGRTYTTADHRRMRLRGNVYRSSITDVKRRYTKHCNVNKMADSSGLGPGKFITLLITLQRNGFRENAILILGKICRSTHWCLRLDLY